jgi:hypothetical protein
MVSWDLKAIIWNLIHVASTSVFPTVGENDIDRSRLGQFPHMVMKPCERIFAACAMYENATAQPVARKQ